jgi:hypothetical protein
MSTQSTRRLATGRVLWVTLGLLVLLPGPVQAERYVRGLLGVAFGGRTTFVDLEDAARAPHAAVGVGALWVGELLGVEVEASRVLGFFQRGSRTLVTGSAVGTVSGSLVVAYPRHLAQYALRPYAVGGAAWLRVRLDDVAGVFRLRRNRPAIVVGGGATGFVTNRVGLNWDVRYVRMVPAREEESGVSFGPPRLRFWRGSMAVAVRY